MPARRCSMHGASSRPGMQGVKSTWRQAAPIVRTTLEGALHSILMQVLELKPCALQLQQVSYC